MPALDLLVDSHVAAKPGAAAGPFLDDAGVVYAGVAASASPAAETSEPVALTDAGPMVSLPLRVLDTVLPLVLAEQETAALVLLTSNSWDM